MMLELKMMEPLLLLIVYLLVSCHCSPAINRTSPYYQKLVALVGNGKVDAVNPLSLFKVEEILGAGTFAKVFKVQSKKRMQARPTGTAQNADSFPTSIALKQMRLDSDEYIKYSINEVIIGRQILKLKIRNVMKYRDFYLYKDKLFMVMDFVPGVNLDSLNPRVFTPLLVVKVTQDLLETVLELNKAGICHVDLGASNIMMDGHGTITIVDFGLAQTIIPSFGDISGEEDFKYTTHCTDEKKAVQMLLDVIRHYFKAQGLILSQEDKGGNLLVKQLERMLNKVKYGQWSIERVLKVKFMANL